jgi:WD40 repeat protein
MIKLRLLQAPDAPGGANAELAACAYQQDDARIITGGWDGRLRIWDAATGAELSSLEASDKPIIAVAASPDDRFYLSACLNGFLAHWESGTLRKAAYFLAHWRPISCIAHDRTGQLMATASWDANLILWSLDAARDWRSLSGHEDIVAGCRFTPQGQTLLSWSHDATLRLWDIAQGETLRRFLGHRDRVTAGDVSHDGSRAVSGSRDQTLRLWDLESAAEISSCTMASPVRACFFLPGDAAVLAVNEDGSVSVHHAPDLDQATELLTELRVQQAALNHQGGQLALACADGRLQRVEILGLQPASPTLSAPEQNRTPSRRELVGKRMRRLLHLARNSASG